MQGRARVAISRRRNGQDRARRDVQQTLFDTVTDLMSRMAPDSLPGIKGALHESRR